MALGDGTAWDETTPSNATNVSDGDDHIRDLRKGVRIRLEKEHNTLGASSAGGEHTYVTLQQQSSKPTLSGSQTGAIYIKDVSSTDELFYQDSGGTETQLTSGGALNISLSAAYPPGYIDGGVISNNATDATNDLDISACNCRDATDGVNIATSALTKQVDATFAVGTNAGGLDTGSIGATQDIIYIFAISDGSSTTDILFSKSSSSPTMPGGYTHKRLIGQRIWDGSKWALHKTVGKGREKRVYLYTSINLVSGGSATSFTNVDVSSYIDGTYANEIQINATHSASGSTLASVLYVRPDGSGDSVGDTTLFSRGYGGGSGVAGSGGGTGMVPITASGIFEYAVNSGTTSIHLRAYTEAL